MQAHDVVALCVKAHNVDAVCVKVYDVVAALAKELGTSVELKSYVRFERGEGIEKEEKNFADEVAAVVGN